jgi:hypothetical protein
MVKSMLEIQDYLRNFSDGQLASLMDQPEQDVPQFLIVTEISKRQKMRNQEKMDAAKDMTTVAEDVVSASGIDNSGIAGMAQAMAPKSSVEQNTGQNQVPTQQGIAGMAGGGEVRRMAAGSSGNVEPRPPAGVGRGGTSARDNWDRLYGETHNPDGTPKDSTESTTETDDGGSLWDRLPGIDFSNLFGKSEDPASPTPEPAKPTVPSINTESLIRQSASTGTPSAANEYEALLKERIEALKGTDLKKQAAIDIMYNIGAGLTSQANLGQALSKGIGGAYESISGRKSQYDDDLLKLTKEKQGIADTRAVRAAAAAKASTPKSSSSSAMLKQITDVKKAMADLLVDDIGAEISPSALTGQDKIMYESLKRQLTALIMSYNMMQGQAGIADLTEPPVSEPLE